MCLCEVIEYCRVGFRGPDREGPRQSGKGGIPSHLAEGGNYVTIPLCRGSSQQITGCAYVNCMTLGCIGYTDMVNIYVTNFTKHNGQLFTILGGQTIHY